MKNSLKWESNNNRKEDKRMEVLRKIRFNGGKATHRLNKGFSAFTLAEMMVVMLIMSIVLAAMAPVMTTKNKVDNSSPWRYSPNNSSDAYFGQGSSMRALIGQVNGEDTDNAKLVINTLGSGFSHILFKSSNDILGDLYLNGTSLVLGSRRNSSTAIGNENINIGHDNWPNSDITGSSNITIGDASMTSLTSGSHNIGLGTTLTSVTTGSHNIGIGDDSLTNITGNGNIAIGGEANANATDVSKTIAIGTNSVASGVGAIAIGSNLTNSEGANINAAKADGGLAIAIGSGSIAGVGSTVETNGSAIAIGVGAKANSEAETGNDAVAIGPYANAKYTASIALGSSANAEGGYTIAIGDDAQATGYGSIAIGMSTVNPVGGGDGYATASGEHSIAIGHGAFAVVDNGIAIGNEAKAPASAYSTSPAAGNIAIGPGAMKYGNSSFGSVAIGIDALQNVDGGTNNIGIGHNTLYNTTSGWHNIALGYDALKNNTTGTYNIALGYGAGNASTSPSYNTALGAYTLYNNQTGGQNTALGYNACQYVTGSNKTCIGAYSGPASGDTWATDDVERIFIGSKSKFNNGPAVLEVHNDPTKDKRLSRDDGRNETGNTAAVVVNGNLIVKGYIMSSLYYKGDGDTFSLHGRTGGQMEAMWPGQYFMDQYVTRQHGGTLSTGSEYYTSDRRLKYVGKESTSGLDKVRQLKVFNYTFKKDTTKTPHVGVIAQDLQKVFPNAVQKGKDGFLTIRMEDMFYAVINAIKELDAKYQAQEKRINDLEKRIEKLEAKK